MKKFYIVVLACVMLFPLTSLAQNLEVHVINVGWGCSVLLRGPDGTTVLMDGGNTGKGTNEIVPYLNSIGVTTTTELNYIIAGHQHCDHTGGLDEVINAGYNVLNKNYYNGSSYASTCNDGFAAAALTTTAGAITSMPVGTQILLGNGAKATCVARNGSIIGGGSVSVSDENDRSIAILVQYGGFDFLWASDLGGGSDACTGRSTSQTNVETAVVQAISPGGASPMISSGGIDVLFCNHHGSESSTNPDWMNLSRPAVSVISTGAGQTTGWDMPRIDVLEHVLLAQSTSCITAPASVVYQNEEGSPTGSLTSFAGYCVGDITITTDGVSTFTVNGNGAVTQGPNEVAAAGLPRAFALDDAGGPPDTTPPVISNVASSGITQNSATITWTTDEASNSVVEYGLTTSYGSTTSNATNVTSHSIGLSGLSASTLYHYRVKSTDAANNTATSGDFTFTTSAPPADVTPPVISNIQSSSITQTTATITWTTDELSNSSVNYGTTTSYGSTTSNATNVTSHTIGLSGLTANTLYHYRVNSTDASNNTATSGDFTFTTLSNITPIETFADGNFTSNPTWGGNTTAFQVVTSSDVAAGATSSNTLRLNYTTASAGTRYIRTQRTATWGTSQSWSFWIGRRAQAATAANHSLVWLWANGTNLTASSIDGYRVRFGDDTGGDNIVLQRVTNNSALDIITSTGTVPNGLTDIGFMVRVTRTSGNVWTLYTSTLPTTSGSGAIATAQPTAANTPINQGSATNSTYTTFTNGYFGFAAVHSSGADARAGAEYDQLYFDTNSSSPLAKSELAIPIHEYVEQLPQAFQLYQNYPNPFNPTTNIRFTLPTDAFVTLTVHDVLGQEVKRLVNGTTLAGVHDVLLDGTYLASGVYYYKMQASPANGAESIVQTKRLVLMK